MIQSITQIENDRYKVEYQKANEDLLKEIEIYDDLRNLKDKFFEDDSEKEFSKDVCKELCFVTCHVSVNAATYAKQEFLDVLDVISRLKNDKTNKDMQEKFKESILRYTWKANKSSTFGRGQATLFIIMIRAAARSAGFDLVQTNELDESLSDDQSSICIDVAALLTPTQEAFVECNMNNIELVGLSVHS